MTAPDDPAPPSPALLRYGGAAAAVLVAGGLNHVLWASVGRSTPSVFFAAVMLAAWYGGLGPGLTAVGLSITSLEYFFEPPFRTITLGVDDVLRIALFAAGSLLIAFLNARWRAADVDLRALNANLERRVAERTGALTAANDALRAEAAERERAEQTRARLEEQLRRAQKLEAIGRLAGGIAHDFNNLLTVIGARSHFLAARLAPGDPLHRDVDIITRTADHAAALTRQLLAFGRRQPLEPRVLDLNTVVLGIQRILERLLGEDIELVTVLDPALGLTRVDPAQLEQVILNLALNARDAMPRGGRLTIETANVELDRTYAAGHLEVEPGPHVMLAVTDTGQGMDAATRARIFEPFFSTKEPGKGTGLGLATVYGVVRQSGGHIWVYSELDQGTTFKVYLPRVAGEAAASGPAAPAPPLPRGGTETILLVEDDAEVRALAREVLEASGYAVLEARTPADALRLAERHPGPIPLMVTDVVLPQMSGRALAGRLAETRPGLSVLYVSGYTGDVIVRHGELDPGTAYVQKPFSPETLLRRVRESLDAPRGASPPG